MKYKKILVIFTIFLTVSDTAIADLTTGLVAYYPFNENANDASGNGNNGQVTTPDVTFNVSGKIGGAAKFIEGTKNSAIKVPYNASLEFTNQGLTVSAWVRLDGIDTDWNGCGNAIISKQNDDYVIWVCQKSGSNGIAAWVGSAHDGINYSQPLPLNEWAHVALTYNGNLVKLYYNSELVNTMSANSVARDSHTDLIIGASPNGGTEEFSGLMDELRIYNRGLSSSEIQQLYAEGTNKSPTISSFTATPKAGNPPLTVNFAVTANDPDGSISAYQWDFTGDGRLDDTTTTGKTSHTYSDLGTFKPNVNIVDNKGAKTKSSSIPITVQYGPDLVGKVESYNFTDKTNTIHIDFKVTNAGDIPARQFPVTFNLSNNGTKVLSTFKNLTVDGLAVGESKTLKVDYTFDASIYGQYILILVDPTKNAAEVDETNNGTRIVVQPMATK